MQTAGLCYTTVEYRFLRRTLSATGASTKLNLAILNVLRNLHQCTQKSFCATNFGPFGEIGAKISLQLSSRTKFTKFKNKKCRQNHCEKHF